MKVQITNAGIAALQANTGPVLLTSFKIGSGVAYVPSQTDTNIHGTLLFTGAPSQPVIVSANVIKYGIYLDYDLGPFSFGEVGLYMANGDLFCLAVADVLIPKLQLTSADVGNSIKIETYLSIVETNYDMWMDLAESNNGFRMAVLNSPDQLPASAQATPNVYIIQAPSPSQTSVLAYTDRNGLWNFDCYAYANQVSASIIGFDSTSVTIDISQFTSDMVPDYLGQQILEFTSGTNYSVCRYVQTCIVSGGTAKLSFATQILTPPVVGDTFTVFKRQPLSNSNVVVPIATTHSLGGIIVGSGLAITAQGLLTLNTAAGLVTSVNGDAGDVVIDASNLPDLALVGKTNNYNDLSGKPLPYALPTGSTTVKGGFLLPTNGHLTAIGGILDFGFVPVITVNGNPADSGGNVTIPVPAGSIGLVAPTLIPASSDFNTYTTAGLFFTDGTTGTIANNPGASVGALEVIPFTVTGTGGDVVQRFTNANSTWWRRLTGATWSSWNTNVLSIASTVALGAVQVGNGLNVSSGGLLSTALLTVNTIAPNPITHDLSLTAADVGALGNPMIATGDLIYSSDGLGTPTRLPVGTEDQVLQVVGGLPVWSDLTSNAMLKGWAYVQAWTLVSATRDANDIVTTASILWPDGATGTYTADTLSTTFVGETDAWHATHVVGSTTKTATQTAVTRSALGGVTAQPDITVV